jgi:hypothetical protein
MDDTDFADLGRAQPAGLPANASRALLEPNAPSRVQTLFEAKSYTCCMDALLQ